MSSSAAATPNQTDTTVPGGAEPCTTTSAAADGGSITPHPPTFWCHECHARVTLLPSDPSAPPRLICPLCRGDFLEETPQSQNLTPSDSGSDDTSFSSEDSAPSAGGDSPISGRAPSPAPSSAVDSLPAVQVSDPSLLCAVCKDEFAASAHGADDATQLPCAHVYHRGCIVPWLSRRNSCPLCRSRLPTGDRNPRPIRRPRLLEHSGSWPDGGVEELGTPVNMVAMLREMARRSMRSFLARMASERALQAERTSMALSTGRESREAVLSAPPVEGGSNGDEGG